MSGKICWTTLVLFNDDGVHLGSGKGNHEKWIATLKRWRKGQSIKDWFFARVGGRHEIHDHPATWGPTSPHHVDWRHFPTYTLEVQDEDGNTVEVWGDKLYDLRERLRAIGYSGKPITVRRDSGEVVGCVDALLIVYANRNKMQRWR